MKSIFNITVRVLKRLYAGPFDSFLKEVNGVIHIGANEGQEREHYNKYGLQKVLWIEADPEAFKKLKKNISQYKNQTALNYLVLDKKKINNFYISNANGSASSILELSKIKEMYPDTKYIKKISLTSYTLSDIIKKQKISIKDYQTLILDTQGSELKILRGVNKLLKNFKYIKLEASNFELYKNNPVLKEIVDYLKNYNFTEVKKIKIDQNKNREKVFDVLFASKK
jgi:FkbM family methyltransferase